MSQENVDALKASLGRFQESGIPDFESFDPEVELINFDTFPVTRRYHGWEGLTEWLVDVSEPFDDFQFELVDVLGHSDDHVVTTCRASGSSKMDGPPFDLVWGVVWTYRRGKVVRAEGFRTPEEALEAVGLPK